MARPPQRSSVGRLRGVLAGTQIVPHVENEIYIIQESNPLIPLVGRDFRALSFEHGPTISGAALGMLWFTGEENESSSQ